jgi:UDP-3-O-[3-hydroxymyristoyl] N-acetylglucosamine deacetylase
LDTVVHTQLATTLGADGVIVGTVEHLMAALMGLGLDNARIELSGPEVPVMDGSAAPFVYLIKDAGVRVQEEYKKFVVIRDRVTIEDQGRWVSVEPDREFSVAMSIDFDHPVVGRQERVFRFSDVAFERELSRARTFGFLHDVEYLKQNGFARGGSLDNAVVIDRHRIINQDGLRYEDEFVRHKILDFIGDISMMGAPIIGRFTANKSGHSLNNMLLRQLAATPEAYAVVQFSRPSDLREENVRLPAWGLLDRPSRQAA